MKLSIIIPTHNRKKSLQKALNSLKAQMRNYDSEIIVVVDGCTDETDVMVKNNFPEVYKVVFLKNVGAAIGLNAGAKNANGEILLFLDDDMEYQPLMIQSHLDMHQEGTYDVLIGHFPLGKMPTDSYFRDVIYDWTEGWQKSFSEDVSFYDSLCSGHFSIKKDLFEKVGGFDEDFSRWGRKDSELGYRLILAGARFGFCLNAQAIQNYDKLPSQFLIDYKFLGRADVEMFQKHPELKSTLLLSAYYQAPWMIQLFREYSKSNSFILKTLFSFIPKIFDFLHAIKVKSKVVEGLIWSAADYYYWEGVKKTLGNRSIFIQLVGNSISILMYHRISEKEEDPFCISKDTFRMQMQFLKDEQYNVLELSDVVTAFEKKTILPPKSVVITFDDACVDFLEAHKILSEFKYPVTLFVPGYFSKNNQPLIYGDNTSVQVLNPKQLQKLHSLGVNIEAHGYKHTLLGKISLEEAEEDIIRVKDWLIKIGISSHYFCYPSGSFNFETQNLLKKHGFKAGLSCISTLASFDSDMFALPRITIEEGDIEDFDFRLRFGIGKQYAHNEFISQLSFFRPAKWWHTAPDFDENRIYLYQTKRPPKTECYE